MRNIEHRLGTDSLHSGVGWGEGVMVKERGVGFNFCYYRGKVPNLYL